MAGSGRAAIPYNPYGTPRTASRPAARAAADPWSVDQTQAMMGVWPAGTGSAGGVDPTLAQWYRPANQAPGLGQPLGASTPSTLPTTGAGQRAGQGGTPMPGMNPYNRDRWYQPVPGTPVASTQAGIPGYVDPPYSNVPTASAFQPGYNPNYAPGASVGSPLANPVGASGAAAATPFVPTTNPTGGTSATTTGTSGGTGATSGSGTIANGPMYGTPGTDQMSLWDPGRFMTGYERALLEAGINPASGNPGAQMAENNAYRAQSRFFADTLLGNNPGTDTQGYIRNAVGNMSNTGYGQTTPFLAKLRQMLSDLANPNFQMPLDQAGAYTYARTLRNGSNEDQVLNAIMGLLPNYAGLRNMRDYLQQRAEQQMAMNPSQGGTFMDALLQILA